MNYVTIGRTRLSIESLLGLNLIGIDWLTKTTYSQFRFPRSKRKRTRKKWSKDDRNWRVTVVPSDEVIVCGSFIYMHSANVQKIKDALAHQLNPAPLLASDPLASASG